MALALIPGIAFAQAKSAVPAYALSILLGFGSGHSYAGSPKSTTFLIGDLASVGVAAVGGVMIVSAAKSGATTTDVSSGTKALGNALSGALVMGLGGLSFSVFRIWEIIDIFGTVETQKKANVLASLNPSIGIGSDGGVKLALSYKY